MSVGSMKWCYIVVPLLVACSLDNSTEDGNKAAAKATASTTDGTQPVAQAVDKTPSLKKVLDGGFFYPQWMDSSSRYLWLHREKHRGLYRYDRSTDEIDTVLPSSYVVKRVVSLDGGKEWIAVMHMFLKRRRHSALLYAKNTDKPRTVVQTAGPLKIVYQRGPWVYFLALEGISAYHIGRDEVVKNPPGRFAYEDFDLQMRLYSNGRDSVLNPFGEGNYIWVQTHPDSALTLMHKVGHGTFIATLEGDIVDSLGHVLAPQWALGGLAVLGMDAYDDGHRFTKSDVLLYHLRSRKLDNLTAQLHQIALYPSMSNDGKMLAFSTPDGEVYVVDLSAQFHTSEQKNK